MNTYSSIDAGVDLQVGISGPPLSEGPLPALFYFALSAKDSLCLDPFNQPVVHIARHHHRLRVFSITLPFHEPPLVPQEALTAWAQAYAQENDILAPFMHQTLQAIQNINTLGYCLPYAISAAGLSRGAFIATHIGARSSLIQNILGFAPLTQLSKAKEFQDLQHLPAVTAYNLEHQIPHLIGKNLRFYIGNHDERVGTHACFSFIEQLTENSYQNRIRSPQVELIIYPSIGYQGHGTPKAIFEKGATWISQQMEKNHA